ncbi:MAG: M60 family metallopeptidase [Candidatus Thalassarchaeaceae archaeon]|jgi:hypothetical protein|nr:M60 family metallopeptidase [Candidatus Thalassarchaeaceae archaeon]
MGLFEPSEKLPDILDCSEQPNHPDCIVDPVTEEDCRHDEVFTGVECRWMERPEQLSYGISSISLNVGEDMQALTPSFVGDGPDTWVVNPPFPQGISFDRESGVISGSPSEATIEIRHTIVASNAVGSTSTWIDLEVTIEGPKSITYAESILDCELGHQCQLAPPSISGGEPDYWSVDPRLPDGISLLADGSIDGSPTQLGDSNHTITISNEGGSVETAIRIIVLHEAPMGLGYGGNRFLLSIGDDVQVVPVTTGGRIVSWLVEPPLPDGLQLLQADGSIRGSPTTVQALTPHRITATNTGGAISVDVLISVVDIPVSNLIYTPDEHDLTIGDEISVTPAHSGGIPDSWYIEPELPSGFTFDSTNGTISGTAADLQADWSSFTIWANNTGGSTSTSFRIRITSLAPDLISWAQTEYALASNESAFIAVTNNGPEIDSWEIEPALPDGLVIITNGSIEGTPTHNIDWTEFTIWANNTGGSVGLNIWIVVHDLRADQSELLSGLDDADWGGWSSLILPIGKWSFPLGRDTTDSTVVAASHVGRGKMIGLGHESWVAQNHEFNFRAVEWVCGEAANVGLAYGAGFDHWEDELRAEGHSVHLSVTPDDLSQVDCLLDEFWNGHDDADNLAIEQFLLGGGGVIMGGHAWYWSYSNSDVPHNYPGNKISKTTGLMVSSDWGYNDIDFEIPDLMYTPHNAIRGIFADRVDGIELTEEEAAIAYSSISDCTVMVPLDFLEFWTPLRELVNSTGWTVIPYSTLWSSTGHELGADPVADVILRLEEALTQNLPADQLPVHPSHTEFPGEVPSNATRISRTVSINGTQSGLPSNFGYSGARSSLRMSTGLYAPPGEVLTVSVSQDVSELGFWILIGAHTDGLWGKDVIKRHSKIYRYWWIDNTTTEIGNAFGGPIYAAIPAGSEFGEFDMTISGAVRAPMFVLGETSDFEWIYSERENPAPWTELVSNNFIMTVPSSEIRNLNNPTELMDWWDEALEMEHELYGYLPWPRVERAVFDAQISAGWMHSGYPFMAHDLSVAGVVNSSYMSENGDWGMFHELGHNHQWMPSTLPGTTETGCNFASVYLMEELVGVEGHGAVDPVQRDSRMRSYFDDGSNIANWSVWIALDTYLIIKEEWDWDPITEALSVYYTLPSAEVPVGDTEEFNAWVMHLSNATGYNLAPYHAAWGFPLTQDTFDSLSHLPIWVDDPLRGEYFVYDAILRNIGANSTTSSTADFAWDTYDNGTNTTLTLYWGTTDMGNQSWVWGNNANLGDSEVGWGEYEVTGLSSGTTYYARVKASNEERDTWFGPVSWTTST